MDTDDAVSGGSTSADESQPPTPASASFSNPRQGGQQYPFGTVPTGGPGLPGGDALPTWAVPEETKGNFGLLGAAGRAGHGCVLLSLARDTRRQGGLAAGVPSVARVALPR